MKFEKFVQLAVENLEGESEKTNTDPFLMMGEVGTISDIYRGTRGAPVNLDRMVLMLSLGEIMAVLAWHYKKVEHTANPPISFWPCPFAQQTNYSEAIIDLSDAVNRAIASIENDDEDGLLVDEIVQALHHTATIAHINNFLLSEVANLKVASWAVEKDHVSINTIKALLKSSRKAQGKPTPGDKDEGLDFICKIDKDIKCIQQHEALAEALEVPLISRRHALTMLFGMASFSIIEMSVAYGLDLDEITSNKMTLESAYNSLFHAVHDEAAIKAPLKNLMGALINEAVQSKMDLTEAMAIAWKVTSGTDEIFDLID